MAEPTFYATETGTAETASVDVTLDGGAESTPGRTLFICAATGAYVADPPEGFTEDVSTEGNLGLYVWRKLSEAGEDTWTFVQNSPQPCAWACFELSDVQAVGVAVEEFVSTFAASYEVGPLTPTAGEKLVIAVVGNSSSVDRAGFTWSDSYVERADQANNVTGNKYALGVASRYYASIDGSTPTQTTATEGSISGADSWVAGIFAIAVGPTAAPPTVDAGQDLIIEAGTDPFTIRGDAEGLNGATVVGHLWTRQSGPVVDLTNVTTATVTVAPPADTGTLVLRYRATDSNGLQAYDELTVLFLQAGRKLYLDDDVSTAGIVAVPATGAGDTYQRLDEEPPSTTDRVLEGTADGTESRWRFEADSPPGANTGVVLEVVLWVGFGAASQSTRVRLYDSDGTTVRKEVTFTDLPTYTEAQVDAGLTEEQIDRATRQIPLTEEEVDDITGWESGLVLGWAPTVT